MKVLSNSSQLEDRILWYDGDSTVTEETLMKFLQLGISIKNMYVDIMSDKISQYNMHVDKLDKLTTKKELKPFDYEWNIPQEYKDIDISEYVIEKLFASTGGTADFWKRAERVSQELQLYEKLGLMPVLATLIYIINTLIENNVVWGVGRGSSVASYVLYLLEVHDIDSFKYELNIEEFLRTE